MEKYPPCPTPTRMEAAREFRGVELERMCSDLDIDPRTYEKWEEVDDDGGEGVYDYDIPPSVELMKEVAEYLRFPLSWFYAGEIQLIATDRYFSPISGSDYLDYLIDKDMKSASPSAVVEVEKKP